MWSVIRYLQYLHAFTYLLRILSCVTERASRVLRSLISYVAEELFLWKETDVRKQDLIHVMNVCEVWKQMLRLLGVTKEGDL